MKTIRLILSTILYEWKAIASNMAVLLVLLGGNIGYGFLYNYIYNPNIVREAPIAVVDMSQDKYSRLFIRNLDATEQVDVQYTLTNYAKAEELIRDRKIVGFLYLPQNFSSLGLEYNTSNIMSYGSTLSFLDFLMLQEATTYTLLDFNAMLRPLYVLQLPNEEKFAISALAPIDVIPTPMFNTTEGYGTYLIPPVLVLIVFQTLMICVCNINGEERERQILNNPFLLKSTKAKPLILVVGKTIAFVLIYSVITFFMLALLPRLFSLPHIGNATTIIVMVIPFLLASTFFALTLLPLCTNAESPLLFIVFMSVILLFFSGISYPLELMPWHWKVFHYIFPSAPATLAFVKINTMGAGIEQIQPELTTLCIQCVCYFTMALCSFKWGFIKGYWNKT